MFLRFCLASLQHWGQWTYFVVASLHVNLLVIARGHHFPLLQMPYLSQWWEWTLFTSSQDQRLCKSVADKSLSMPHSYSLIQHNIFTCSHKLFTWQHSSCKMAHLLQSGGPSLLTSERGPRHSLQPGTWRAASSGWSSACVKASNLAGIAVPTPSGLWHVATVFKNVPKTSLILIPDRRSRSACTT